jgi:hypothetical protein
MDIIWFTTLRPNLLLCHIFNILALLFLPYSCYVAGTYHESQFLLVCKPSKEAVQQKVNLLQSNINYVIDMHDKKTYNYHTYWCMDPTDIGLYLVIS